MEFKRLEKLRDFEVVFNVPGVRYRQDGEYFNCGGYPVIDGKAQGLPDNPHSRKIELNLTSRPQKTAAEAARDAQQMIDERDGKVYACSVKDCGKECKTEVGLKRHMSTVHPGITNV